VKRAIIPFVLLVMLHVLVVGHYSAWDWALGAVLALALLAFFRRFVFAEEARPHALALPLRLAAFIPFAFAVGFQVLRGTVAVGLVVLGVRPVPESGLVEVPVGEMTPAGVKVTALVHSLAPGLVFVDVDWQRGVMLFHGLDARDPEKVRREVERFYRRYQRAVFP
jgi:multisubunit Na+/H+ antiporter MnhE subunit